MNKQFLYGAGAAVAAFVVVKTAKHFLTKGKQSDEETGH